MFVALLLLAAPMDVLYTRLAPWFVRNDAPAGDYWVFTDRASFDRVMHARATKKPVEMPDFGKVSVVCVIKRGNAPCGFRVEAVSREGTSLRVSYKATEGPQSPSRTWANFLMLSVPKGSKSVVWVENGREVHRR